MGVTSWLRGEPNRSRAAFVGGAAAVAADPTMQRGLLQLAGYSPSQLPTTITRTDALKVPALSQGVATLLSIGSMLPLVATPSTEPESFLTELDPDLPRGFTIAKTLDDLIFYGIGWWLVTSRNSRSFPRTVRRIDPQRVMVDPAEGTIRVDGQPVDPDDMKRFDGLVEGLLVRGSEAITTALANVRQARVYATNPKPSQTLTDPPDVAPMAPAEARDYVNTYAETIRTHGIGYLANFIVTDYGWSAAEIQLVEARQQDAVEAARLLAMPSDYVNAPAQGSSLHYANIQEVRRDLIDVGGLAQYLGPIEQRLSMPDMTPRGTEVRFDSESVFLRITPDQPSPSVTPALTDSSQGVANG